MDAESGGAGFGDRVLAVEGLRALTRLGLGSAARAALRALHDHTAYNASEEALIAATGAEARKKRRIADGSRETGVDKTAGAIGFAVGEWSSLKPARNANDRRGDDASENRCRSPRTNATSPHKRLLRMRMRFAAEKTPPCSRVQGHGVTPWGAARCRHSVKSSLSEGARKTVCPESSDARSQRVELYNRSIPANVFERKKYFHRSGALAKNYFTDETIGKLKFAHVTYAHQFAAADMAGSSFQNRASPRGRGAASPARVNHLRQSQGFFATAGEDGCIKIWDPHAARLCYTIRHHCDEIRDLDVSTCGRFLLSCCSAHSVKLWRLGGVKWKYLGTIRTAALPSFVRFLPETLPEPEDVLEAVFPDPQPLNLRAKRRNSANHFQGSVVPGEAVLEVPYGEGGLRSSPPAFFVVVSDTASLEVYDAVALERAAEASGAFLTGRAPPRACLDSPSPGRRRRLERRRSPRGLGAPLVRHRPSTFYDVGIQSDSGDGGRESADSSSEMTATVDIIAKVGEGGRDSSDGCDFCSDAELFPRRAGGRTLPRRALNGDFVGPIAEVSLGGYNCRALDLFERARSSSSGVREFVLALAVEPAAPMASPTAYVSRPPGCFVPPPAPRGPPGFSTLSFLLCRLRIERTKGHEARGPGGLRAGDRTGRPVLAPGATPVASAVVNMAKATGGGAVEATAGVCSGDAATSRPARMSHVDGAFETSIEEDLNFQGGFEEKVENDGGLLRSVRAVLSGSSASQSNASVGSGGGAVGAHFFIARAQFVALVAPTRRYGPDTSDVAFAGSRYSVLTGSSASCSAAIWPLTGAPPTGPNNGRGGLACPLVPTLLIPRIREKLRSGAYRVYHHPLSSSAKAGGAAAGAGARDGRAGAALGHSTDAAEKSMQELCTTVNAVAWCDDDRVCIVAAAVFRRGTKRSHLRTPDKCIAKETEIALFDARSSSRLLSFMDHKHLNRSVAFVRPHPFVSNIVAIGVFPSLLLLCDFELRKINQFVFSPRRGSEPVETSFVESGGLSIRPQSAATSRFAAADAADCFNPKLREFRSIFEASEAPPRKPEGGKTASSAPPKVKHALRPFILQAIELPKASFLCGEWVAYGTRFAVGRSDGSVVTLANSISGKRFADQERSATGDPFDLSPVEQFFDNDFRALSFDGRTGILSCRMSGVAPHELSRGPAVDCMRTPLWQQPPLPVASRAGFRCMRAVGSLELRLLGVGRAKLVPLARRGNAARLDVSGFAVAAAQVARRSEGARGDVDAPLAETAAVSALERVSRAGPRLSSNGNAVFPRRFGTILSAAYVEDADTDSSYIDSGRETRRGRTSGVAGGLLPRCVSSSSDGEIDDDDAAPIFVGVARRVRMSSESVSDGGGASAAGVAGAVPAPGSSSRARSSAPAPLVVRPDDPADACMSAYWSFWTSQRDPLGRFKLLLAETPTDLEPELQRPPEELVSAAVSLVAAALNPPSPSTAAAEAPLPGGVSHARLRVVLAVDALLRTPQLIRWFDTGTREILFQEFMSASRAHRLLQRRLRRGDSAPGDDDPDLLLNGSSEEAVLSDNDDEEAFFQRYAAQPARALQRPPLRRSNRLGSRAPHAGSAESSFDSESLRGNGAGAGRGRRRWVSGRRQSADSSAFGASFSAGEGQQCEEASEEVFLRALALGDVASSDSRSIPANAASERVRSRRVPVSHCDGGARRGGGVRAATSESVGSSSVAPDEAASSSGGSQGRRSRAGAQERWDSTGHRQSASGGRRSDSRKNTAASREEPLADGSLDSENAGPSFCAGRFSELQLLSVTGDWDACDRSRQVLTGRLGAAFAASKLFARRDDLPEEALGSTHALIREKSCEDLGVCPFCTAAVDATLRLNAVVRAMLRGENILEAVLQPPSLPFSGVCGLVGLSDSFAHAQCLTAERAHAEAVGEKTGSHKAGVSIAGEVAAGLGSDVETGANVKAGAGASPTKALSRSCVSQSGCVSQLGSVIQSGRSESTSILIADAREGLSAAFSLRLTRSCKVCARPATPAISCHKCNASYHERCAAAAWSETDFVHVLDPVRWGSLFVCPSEPCVTRFRRTFDQLLTGKVFASERGLQGREWLSSDVRAKGDYVPQLGDVVRLFPSEGGPLEGDGFGDPAGMLAQLAQTHPALASVPADAVVIDVDFRFPFERSLLSTRAASSAFAIESVLTVLILPPHAAAGMSASFSYRPVPNRSPVVLRSDVEAGLERQLAENSACAMYIDGEFYEGRVRRLFPAKAASPAAVPRALAAQPAAAAWWSAAASAARPFAGLGAVSLEWEESDGEDAPSARDGEGAGGAKGEAGPEGRGKERSKGQGSAAGARRASRRDGRARSLRGRRASLSSMESSCASSAAASAASASAGSAGRGGSPAYHAWEVSLRHDRRGLGGLETMDAEMRAAAVAALDAVSAKPTLGVRLRSRPAPELRFAQFLAPVPWPAAAEWGREYYGEIPLPIDLGLIRRRLANYYYRHAAGFWFDLQLLWRNAVAFNGEKDVTTQNAEDMIRLIVAHMDGGCGDETAAGAASAAATTTVADDDPAAQSARGHAAPAPPPIAGAAEAPDAADDLSNGGPRERRRSGSAGGDSSLRRATRSRQRSAGSRGSALPAAGAESLRRGDSGRPRSPKRPARTRAERARRGRMHSSDSSAPSAARLSRLGRSSEKSSPASSAGTSLASSSLSSSESDSGDDGEGGPNYKSSGGRAVGLPPRRSTRRMAMRY